VARSGENSKVQFFGAQWRFRKENPLNVEDQLVPIPIPE
jgi:hypothetical protein